MTEDIPTHYHTFFFDLDGTLADLSHRLHFIEGEEKDYKSFFAACSDDKPIWPIIELCHALQNEHIIILSGRSDECRNQTKLWLNKYVPYYDALYMRKEGDHRLDVVVKKELMDQAIADGWVPILIVEDRQQVVDMWRSLGYTCLQCTSGDY